MHDEAGNVFAKEVLTDDMKAFHLEADRLGITALRLKLEAFEKSLTSIKEPIRHDHPTEGRKIPNTIDGVHIGDHYFGTAYAYEIVLENGKSRFTDITMRDCRLVYFDGRPSDVDHDCCYEINGANEELAKRKRFAEHSIAYLKSRIALGPNGCELSSSLAYEQERKNVMKLSRHLKRMKAHSLRLQKPNWVSLPGDHIRVDGFGSRWQIQGYVVAQYRNFDGMTIRTAPSEGVGVRKLQDEVLIVGTVPVVAPIVAIIDVVKRYWPSASRSLRKRLDRGYLFSRYWKSVKGKHADFHSGSPHQWELYESTKYLNNLIETHTAAIELANRKVNDYRAFRRDQKLKSTDSDLNGLAEANAQKRQMEIAFEFEETEEQLSDYMCEVDYLRSQLERMRDPKKIQIEGNHEFKLGKNTHSHSDFYCYQFQDFDNRWVSTAASQGQCKIYLLIRTD